MSWSSRQLPGRVRILSLRSNKSTDVGARALADSAHAKNLLQLNLNNDKIGPAGKKALGESKHLSDTRVLV